MKPHLWKSVFLSCFESQLCSIPIFCVFNSKWNPFRKLKTIHLGQSGIQARKLGTQNGEENGSSLNIILLSGKCGPFLGSPEVKWYKGREQITDSEDFRYENDGDTYRLVIAEVFPEDSGMYKCVAENEAGTASSSFTVFVEGTIEKM